MFGVGIPELLIILVIVVLVFGAGKLPQLGQALGSSIQSFKKASREDADPPKNALPGKGEASMKEP